RLVLPESFLATDAMLILYENVASGLEVHPARIRRRLADELPFMATEQLLVRAVRGGGDRQEKHETIRRHSIEAARALKDGAARNDLFDRLGADRSFGVPLAELEQLADPTQFTGRAAAQVDEFLAEVADPILKASPAAASAEALRV
ncbi:MAG TPA: adenylosuccinate lyase, partial [Gemmatimonadaceae bacterium]|nr:adenylosuccinate lyase [Gemmatimonadaceae bacterium]